MLSQFEVPGPHRPGTALVLAHAIGTLVLAYTSSSQQVLRKFAALVFAMLTLAANMTLVELHENATLRCLVITFAWAQTVSLHDLLCLTKIDHASSNRSRDIPSRLKWALSTQWNLRRIGEKSQAKNIPSVAEWFGTGIPGYVPNRFWFAVDRLITVGLSVAYMAIFGIHSEKVPEFYTIERESLLSRLSDVTYDEGIYRAKATVAWIAGIAATSQISYNVIALAFVLTGLSEPRMWPSWFGPLHKAYSLRNWWGIFWQQTWQRMLATHSNWIAYDILNMGKSSATTRYVKVFVVFFISGLLHLAPDLTLGIPLHETQVVTFYCMQSVGIMVEDFFSGVNSRLGLIRNGVMARILGYLWVAAWLYWQVPTWAYATARHMDTEKDYLFTNYESSLNSTMVAP